MSRLTQELPSSSSSWIYLLLILLILCIATLQAFDFNAAATVQRRVSILRPWKSIEDKDKDKHNVALGWTVETRNRIDQTYQVQVTWNHHLHHHASLVTESRQRLSFHSFVGDNSNSNNKDKDKDTVTADSHSQSVVVHLPYFEREESLASSLWPGSLAASILCSAPSVRRALNHSHTIMELGCGLGLTGITACHHAQHCRLTDNDQNVLAAVEQAVQQRNRVVQHKCSVQCLEWRDIVMQPEENNGVVFPPQNHEQVDVIVSSDVAYYHFLLRPLMDTVTSFLRRDSDVNNKRNRNNNALSSSSPSLSSPMWLCFGQANREAQWQLYHNLVDGCYNPRTDTHEAPWFGVTAMLLYALDMHQWQAIPSTDEDDHPSLDASSLTRTENELLVLDGSLPMCALVYMNDPDARVPQLTEWDYLATAQDENSLYMTF